MKKYLSLIFLGLLLASCAHRQQVSTPEAAKRAGKESVKQLAESYFEEYLKLFPLFATSIGDNRYNDKLDFDIQEEHLATQARLYDFYLAKLGALDTNQLNSADRLTFDAFRDELQRKREALNWPYELLPIRQLYSLPVVLPLLGSGRGNQPFKTVKDYDAFLLRAGEFPAWVDAAIANMRKGMFVGVVQAKIVVDRTLPQLKAMTSTNAEKNVFYQPIQTLPESFPASEKFRLARAYGQMIQTKLIPAYRKLHDFLLQEYRPKCRDAEGIWVLPRGRAWYRQAIRYYTTTDFSPDEIHEMGKAEVTRIELEMQRIKERTGFKGSLPEFIEFLETRPGTSITNREALVQAYEGLRQKVAPGLSNLFTVLPGASFEIRAIEEFREASTPSHYFSPTPDGSRPGIFYVNAARIKDGSQHLSEALFLHEAIPGHHFQISLAMEQASLPRFRKFGLYNAFAEGWALYAESLGSDLGCYQDPLQVMDRLSSEMWRARRLVVDTGLHEERWTRDQAIEYLRQNPVQVMSAELETDRYIAWPGQALSYKLGELEIQRLKGRAREFLGAKFNIRHFHDQVLQDGSLPLSILDSKLQQWMVAEGVDPQKKE